MKMIWIKRSLRILLLGVALWAVISCFGRSERNYITIRDFYHEPRNSMDVVFLGASEVSTDVCSVYAFELSGLTGYQYGVDSNLPSLYLAQLRDILSRQKPQLIVVEVNGFLTGSGDALYDDAKIRTYLDPTPLSLRKLKTMSRLPLQETYSSYVFPFEKTHSQWEHPQPLMSYILTWPLTVARGYTLLKGYVTQPIRLEASAPKPIPMEKLPLCNDEVQTLFDEFTAYCVENDLPVLFVRFPHCLSVKREENAYRRFLTIKEQLTAAGLPCLDLQELQEALAIGPGDFYNESHLNIYGQEKLTAFLVDRFCSEYGLRLRTLTAAESRHWNKCVAYYHELRELAEESMDVDPGFLFEEAPLLYRLRRRMAEK